MLNGLWEKEVSERVASGAAVTVTVAPVWWLPELVVLTVWTAVLSPSAASGGGVLTAWGLKVFRACSFLALCSWLGLSVHLTFLLKPLRVSLFCSQIVWSSVSRPVKAKWLINLAFENSTFKLWDLSNLKIHLCSHQSVVFYFVVVVDFTGFSTTQVTNERINQPNTVIKNVLTLPFLSDARNAGSNRLKLPNPGGRRAAGKSS